jgi:hypothetical protein
MVRLGPELLYLGVLPWRVLLAAQTVLFLIAFSSAASAAGSLPANLGAAPSPAGAGIPELNGVVADSSGAIVPGAQVQLLDASAQVVASTTTDQSGVVVIRPPRMGDFTLSVLLNGFATSTQAVHVGVTKITPLNIILAPGAVATQIIVSGASDVDLTDSAKNESAVTMTTNDLQQLPVYDNDYISAVDAFMDSGMEPTAGAGPMVDGAESNRATVSPSAVRELRINQDQPETRPGRDHHQDCLCRLSRRVQLYFPRQQHGSEDFAEVTNAYPPRRVQLGTRFIF